MAQKTKKIRATPANGRWRGVRVSEYKKYKKPLTSKKQAKYQHGL